MTGSVLGLSVSDIPLAQVADEAGVLFVLGVQIVVLFDVDTLLADDDVVKKDGAPVNIAVSVARCDHIEAFYQPRVAGGGLSNGTHELRSCADGYEIGSSAGENVIVWVAVGGRVSARRPGGGEGTPMRAVRAWGLGTYKGLPATTPP